MSVFEKGTKVTICSDAEGKHPRRIGFVKRIGNGAWRLAECSEWYNFDGKRVAVDGDRFAEYANTTHFARLYQEGDEAAILVENERVKKHKELVASKSNCEWRIRQERSNIHGNLATVERSVAFTSGRVEEAERNLRWAKTEHERAVAQRTKVATQNEQHAKAIADNEAKLALIEAELAKFGVEW